jgi:hypothetical protein
MEVLIEREYLLNRNLYRTDVYQKYSDRCADMKIMIFRKNF